MESKLKQAVAFFEMNFPLDRETFSSKWIQFVLSSHPDKPGGSPAKVSNETVLYRDPIFWIAVSNVVNY